MDYHTYSSRESKELDICKNTSNCCWCSSSDRGSVWRGPAGWWEVRGSSEFWWACWGSCSPGKWYRCSNWGPTATESCPAELIRTCLSLQLKRTFEVIFWRKTVSNLLLRDTRTVGQSGGSRGWGWRRWGEHQSRSPTPRLDHGDWAWEACWRRTRDQSQSLNQPEYSLVSNVTLFGYSTPIRSTNIT